MRILLPSIFVLFSILSNAQERVSIAKADNITSISLTYGQHAYLTDFGNNFNSLDEYEAFQPVQSVGFLINVFEPGEGKYRLGNLISYSQIVPQDIRINDTLNGKINGFNFGLSLIQVNLTPNVKWSFIGLGFGFNTGRMRITSEAYRSRKNPFWAPAIFFNPQFHINRFVIGIKTSYQFDITRRRWQPLKFSNKSQDFDLNEFRQTGFNANVCIGLKLK